MTHSLASSALISPNTMSNGPLGQLSLNTTLKREHGGGEILALTMGDVEIVFYPSFENCLYGIADRMLAGLDAFHVGV